MQLQLNTWQRLKVCVILGTLEGNIHVIRKAMKALDVLELSEDEKKLVGFQQMPSGATWKNVEHCFNLEIGDKESLALVKTLVKSYKEWPVSHYKDVEDLFKQLGIEIEGGDGQVQETEKIRQGAGNGAG